MENLNIDNNQAVETGVVEENQEPKSYTQEEMMSFLQKETDRRVSAALKKQEAKFQNKLNEADKLRGMNDEQKAQYEFEQKVKDFEAKQRDFNLLQNKVEAQSILNERGLPLQMVEYIVAEDAETMLERINEFETMFKAAVNDAVSKRIASPAPKASGSVQSGMTKEQYRGLTIAQQSELLDRKSVV